jgi:hypothetical protein
MPPLAILDNRAFLVSPLEIPVYLLELPVLKDALLEGEIRNRLKALYPGAPENTVIDYTLFPGKKKTAPQAALVYVCSRATGDMCRGLQLPLVPGTAIMRIALRGAGLGSALCVMVTEEWVEAAFFEDARILRYGSCPAPSDPSTAPPFSFIASFVNSGEQGPAAALLVSAGSPEERNEQTEKLLGKFFDPVIKIDINAIAIKGTLKRLGIFADSRRRSLARQKKVTGALLILNGASLLLSLHIVAGRTRLELSRLEQQEREQRQSLDRAKALESAIAELAGDAPEDRGGKADPYGIIAGLQRCLSGGWIKSLVIQGDNFDLEAEGADSIGVVQSLQASGLFGELSLRRASKSPLAGDLFTISGRTGNYGKK